jgi:hypothetical protein
MGTTDRWREWERKRDAPGLAVLSLLAHSGAEGEE